MKSLLAAAFLTSVYPLLTHALPDPKTGGKDGGPISVLFLMSRGGAGEQALDPEVARRLTERGYVLQTVSQLEPLTAEFLRQFNTIVLVGLEDFAGGRYYSPAGVHLLNARQNVPLFHSYVEDGGGLVIVPLMAEAGSQVASTYGELIGRWGIGLGYETVRDDDHTLNDPQDPSKKIEYASTRNITKGPLTEGVTALAYPTLIMRWDDAYGTTPLLLKDQAWQALAHGEPSSKGMRSVGHGQWSDGDAGTAPVLAAVRDAGKGRVAAVGLGSYYLLSYAFAEKNDKGARFNQVGENTTGPMEGIAYARGDGQTPSEWGRLFDHLLGWTAEAGAKAGFGGQPGPWESKRQKISFPADPVPEVALINWKNATLPATWAHHAPTPVWWRGSAFYDEIPDPLVTGPQQMNKLLIGAHSKYSDGKGSVADWAKAAKAAGYAAVVFTERFEDFQPENWAKFVSDCAAHSSPEFTCLQGLDIPDDQGNRFLLLGNLNFPSPGMLTSDGKALQQTARLSLGFSQHIAVVHRLGSSKGLPTELCRHFQGITVYTYAEKDGKFQLADDAYDAYLWQLWNASNPVPIVAHELYDPADVAAKGTVGFQQIVPSQDAVDAIRYFRYGMDHFFENPQRYFITEGPIIDGFAILNKDIGYPELNRDHWRALIGARSPDPQAPIKEAVLYDRGVVARRWTPNAASFSEFVDGEHGYQRYFLLELTDRRGRRAISPHLRTVTRGYYTRCGDRQNWFGAAGSYTGIWPSGVHAIWYVRPWFAVAGQSEQFGGEHPLATKMSLPFASNPLTFTDYTIDSKYIRQTPYGMDAWKIENVLPTETYELRARVGRWHDIPSGVTNFGNHVAILTSVDAVLRSRVEAKPDAPLFPIINSVARDAAYRFLQEGKLVEGRLDGKPETLLDLPAGASLGDFFLLAPLTVSGRGEMGWRADAGQTIPAQTEWRAAYLYVLPTAGLRAALGAEGDLPWRLALTQGQLLERVLGTVNLVAENGGVAGRLKAGGEVKFLPLKVTGLNVNWPAALWSTQGSAYSMWSGLAVPSPLPGTQSGPPFLAHIGVFDGTGYAALDNSADREFYVGHTLMASNPALALSFTYWTKSEAGIEAHNPTDQPITARLTSPKTIPGKLAINTEVTVPAGSTVRLELPKK